MVILVSSPPTMVFCIRVVMMKLAVVEPAGTVTLVGTLAIPVGSAASDTSMSTGAGLSSATVPRSEFPPTTLAELKLIAESLGLSAAYTATPRKHTSNDTMIFFISNSLRSKLKNNVYYCSGINWLSFMQRRIELDLLRRFDRLLIQPVP